MIPSALIDSSSPIVGARAEPTARGRTDSSWKCWPAIGRGLGEHNPPDVDLKAKFALASIEVRPYAGSAEGGLMPDFTKRVRKKLDLPTGEDVVQAAVAQPSGSISRGFAEKRTTLGAVSSSLATKMSEDGSIGQIADRVPSKNGYLVVTNRRVVWADQAKTGSVGGIIAQFSFGEIAGVELTDGGGMSNKLLSIAFSDQSRADVAVAKGAKPDRLHAALVDALVP